MRVVMLALVLLSAANAWAFEGTVNMSATMGAMGTIKTTVYVRKNGDTRIDSEVPMAGNMQMSVIKKGGKQSTMLYVMHAMKQYMEMPAPETAPAQADASQKLDEYDIKKLGKEKVAGLDAEHVQLTHKKQKGNKVDMWLTKDKGLAEAMSAMAADPKMANPFLKDLKAKNLDGYPVKMVMNDGQNTMIIETTKIEAKTLDATLFAVPAGYTKAQAPAGMPMGAPGMGPPGGMPPGAVPPGGMGADD